MKYFNLIKNNILIIFFPENVNTINRFLQTFWFH